MVYVFGWIRKVLVFFALLPVYFYRLAIRPLLDGSCCFYPSCSEYALQSVKRFGVITGYLYAGGRILRCQPFSKRSGYDPVPWGMKGAVKWVV